MTRMTGPDCVVMLLLLLTFSVLVAISKNTSFHGGKSRSLSYQQGKENKKRKSGSASPPPPPPPTLLVHRKKKKSQKTHLHA